MKGKMMKKTAILIGIFLFSTMIFSADGEIFLSGTVTLHTDCKPVTKAMVMVLETESKANTDEYGKFSIILPSPGTYTLIVEAEGNQIHLEKIVINSSKTKDIKLKPLPATNNKVKHSPNVIPPKPVGKLKKTYPKSARDAKVEATVATEISIDINGKIISVRILGVKLSKTVSLEIQKLLKNDFGKETLNILMGAQFTPAIIDGKRSPIKMELPLKFKLEDL
ncbi:MAG TPA: energy transducer TonB [Spirochaetota bacterium]|nr:energy transducer TonB [Spirochaetota bacterium]HOR45653.1 energy transducer TonB [Spirochaetota bacterium]HPK57281.1 energy transducer TonB [Spirochaetota bacterium]